MANRSNLKGSALSITPLLDQDRPGLISLRSLPGLGISMICLVLAGLLLTPFVAIVTEQLSNWQHDLRHYCGLLTIVSGAMVIISGLTLIQRFLMTLFYPWRSRNLHTIVYMFSTILLIFATGSALMHWSLHGRVDSLHFLINLAPAALLLLMLTYLLYLPQIYCLWNLGAKSGSVRIYDLSLPGLFFYGCLAIFFMESAFAYLTLLVVNAILISHGYQLSRGRSCFVSLAAELLTWPNTDYYTLTASHLDQFAASIRAERINNTLYANIGWVLMVGGSLSVAYCLYNLLSVFVPLVKPL